MSGREAILGAIREALRRPSPPAHAEVGPASPSSGPVESADLAAAFRERFEAAGGVWHEAADLAGAARLIEALLPPGPVWVALDGLALDRPGVLRAMPPRDRFDSLVATVTGVDCAIAETGSLGLFFAPGAGRLASLVAPVHVAIVRRDQHVATLEHFLGRVQAHLGPRSAAVLVTGPSRSADIEQILTIGVHGTREVHVIVMETSS
jgi:L-lactate dehydrogenase complex protein LldG